MRIERNPSDMTLFKIWWAITWRSAVYLVIFTVLIFIVFFAAAFTLKTFGVSKEGATSILTAISWMVSLPAGVYIFIKSFKRMMSKTFDNLSVKLVYNDRNESTAVDTDRMQDY